MPRLRSLCWWKPSGSKSADVCACSLADPNQNSPRPEKCRFQKAAMCSFVQVVKLDADVRCWRLAPLPALWPIAFVAKWPIHRRDPPSADLALVLIGEGKAACAPPARRCPRRSPVVAGQTAVGVMTPRRSDGARRPASDAGRCPPSAAPRVRSVNGRRDIGRPQ